MIDHATPAADWAIVLPVVLSLLGAALLLMLRRSRALQPVFAVLVALAVIASDLALLMRVVEAGPQTMTMGRWLPPFGISFTADLMGAAFALGSAITTLVVLVFAAVDTDDAERRKGFYPLVLLMLGGASGAFLTGDLFNLYVWFELLLISAFGLLVLSGRDIVLDAAIKYGVLNFLGTSLFLLALGLLYGLVGTLNMADIVLAAPTAPIAPLTAIAAIVLLSFGLKAAAFPVNGWLAASYHAPPAVISGLFAGLLTKVGVYALLRTLVMLLPMSRDLLAPVIGGVAILTLVMAPLGAIAETNLRRALGFFVIGGIGAVLAGMALGSPKALSGASLYAFQAILVLPALYMAAGLIEKVTGARDTSDMGGVYAASAPLSILFLTLVLTTAGTPPLLGFWPKLQLLEASVEGYSAWGLPLWLTMALVINALLTLIAGTRLWSHIFWRVGREGAMSELPNDRLRRLTPAEIGLGYVPAALLAALTVLLGLWPEILLLAGRIIGDSLIDPAAYIASVGLAVRP
jgi:multicomponent Na+:H+ antiporter subunit D